MGTRADFYVKRDKELIWLGSTAWDGYGVANANDEGRYSPNEKETRSTDYLEYLIHHSTDESEYISLVAEYIEKRKDGTHPSQGWPWPWDNSKLTDECYVFDTNQLLRMRDHDGNYDDHSTPCVFAYVGDELYDENDESLPVIPKASLCVPDMSDIQNVAAGKRSGVIMIRL